MAVLLTGGAGLGGCVAGGMEKSSREADRQALIERGYRYLSRHLHVNTPVEEMFKVQSVERDATGRVHLRFVQQADGVPVWGEELLLHMTPDGDVYRMGGKWFPELDGFRLPLLMNEATVLRRAFAEEMEGWENRGLYLYRNGEETIPVYEMERMKGLKRQRVLVDARSGEIVKQLEGNPSR